MFSYDALYINSGSLYFDGTDVSCLSRRLNNLTGIAFGSYICQVVGCRLHRRIVCHHSGFCDIKPLKSRSHIGPPFLSPSTDA